MRVLSISYDLSLLQSRELLLQQIDFDVVSAHGFTPAHERCKQGGFDIMLLGHSIPEPDKAALIESFKKASAGTVVALLRPMEPPQEGADHSVDAADPRGLLRLLQQIAHNASLREEHA